MNKKTIAIVAVVVIAILAAVLWFVVRPQMAAQQTGQYETAAAELGDLTAVVGATGTVRANQSALLNWQTSGTIEQINVKEGDHVKQGDVLASLAPTSLSQSIILAKADLVNAERALESLQTSDAAQAKAQLSVVQTKKIYEDTKRSYDSLNKPRASQKTIDDAQKDLDDATKMVAQAEAAVALVTGLPDYDPRRIQAEQALKQARSARDFAQKVINWYTGHPTEDQISEAEAKLAVAQANYDDALREWERLKDGPDPQDVAAAQARVDAIKATLKMASIVAPFNGMITRADPLPGDQVSPGAVAFRLDDLGHMLVDVQISEIDVNNVDVGQKVTLTFDAIPDKQYTGVVRDVGQVGNVTQGAVNFTTTVELIDFDKDVKPGMTAAATLNVSELKDVLIVPNRAVRFVDGNRVVYVLKDGQLDAVKITLGASSDLYSEVISGDLKAGDVIVLNPPTTFGGPGGGMMGGN